MKYKIEKVTLNSSGNWKNFNNLRNDSGVLSMLEETAQNIGELETSYKATTRAHAIAKVDKETYKTLISGNKATERKDDE